LASGLYLIDQDTCTHWICGFLHFVSCQIFSPTCRDLNQSYTGTKMSYLRTNQKTFFKTILTNYLRSSCVLKTNRFLGIMLYPIKEGKQSPVLLFNMVRLNVKRVLRGRALGCTAVSSLCCAGHKHIGCIIWGFSCPGLRCIFLFCVLSPQSALHPIKGYSGNCLLWLYTANNILCQDATLSPTHTHTHTH